MIARELVRAHMVAGYEKGSTGFIRLSLSISMVSWPFNQPWTRAEIHDIRITERQWQDR